MKIFINKLNNISDRLEELQSYIRNYLYGFVVIWYINEINEVIRIGFKMDLLIIV